jgi:hypothetical protein
MFTVFATVQKRVNLGLAMKEVTEVRDESPTPDT